MPSAFTQTAAPQPLSLQEIAEGIYAFKADVALMDHANAGAIANLGIIIGDEAVAVIDTGGSVIEGDRFLAAIRQKTDRPIRYIINTHEHPDHIFGNAAFETLGATFVGHKNLPRAIEQRRAFYLSSFREIIGEDMMKGVKLIAPTLLVSDETELDLGHRKLRLKAWPAMHTDCDLTVFDEKTATLFTGDLAFLQHVPVVDGSLKGWLSHLDALAAIPAQRVVPGHGDIGVAWPQALEAQRTYLTKLTKDLRGLIKEGADVDQAAKTAAQSEAGKWQLFKDYNPRNATAGFAELEWE